MHVLFGKTPVPKTHIVLKLILNVATKLAKRSNIIVHRKKGWDIE